uniref:AntA/AntB antirepressor domain-containing protein n=1 Tax=Arsenophonus endosymbiont of Trialeurodes vaporariorum TaxID=235567 RepID=A0A3B0MKV8_9GAMM
MRDTLIQNLINIKTKNISGELIQTVNARDLHAFLEIGKDFITWIKDRIKQYGFAENIDFIVFTNSGENPFGGRPTKEYHISLDMAKELSMVERNEKGKQARQYFIECERRILQPQLHIQTLLPTKKRTGFHGHSCRGRK